MSQVRSGEEHPEIYVCQPETPGQQENLLYHREGGAGDKVDPGEAPLLPPRTHLHPGHRPRPPEVDGHGQRYRRPGDALVPGAAGLPLPGGPPARTRTRQRRRTVPERRLPRSIQGGPRLAAEGGGVWQPQSNWGGRTTPAPGAAPSPRTGSPREVCAEHAPDEEDGRGGETR